MPQPHQKRRPQNRRASGPNRSQQRESAVRAEQMAAEPSPELLDGATDATTTVPEVVDTPAAAVPASPAPRTPRAEATGSKRRRDSSRSRATSVPAPVAPTISHAQEYAFIRADLRRLLITAGLVLVVMLVLLFFIEG